ncbi:MAG: alpha/beta hydrolase, partial [Planctomycetaceae bacterium]
RPRSCVWTAKLGRSLLIYAVVPYLAVVAIFTLFQRRLIYQPTRQASLRAADFGLAPTAARDVQMTAEDGLTLHGWLLFADQPAHNPRAPDDVRTSEQLVIYFPGNAGHRGYRTSDFLEFTRQGLDVLIFDYRGYGENPGAPSEPAMQADARAACRFAREELGADPSRIVLFGESMGGAVAIALAAEMCEQGTPPSALITNATFASLAETVKWHYPWFPFQFVLRDRWPSVQRIPHVTCPVLMFHGARDDIVPFSQGRELFAAVPSASTSGRPKQFVELPANGHNDIPVSLLDEELHAFLPAVLPRTPVAD